MKKLALAAILAGTTTLGVAGFAAAERHGGHGKGHMMEKLDTNGDGQISRAEVDALKAERFSRADANSDGSLTMDEMEAFHEAERERRKEERKQRRFERRDANGDGVISADEFDSRGDRMFDRVDANDDDVITKDEMKAMKKKHGKHGGHHRRGGPESDATED